MVNFRTKNRTLGKFGRALDWKMLLYYIAIWNIWLTFGIFYDYLVHFVIIWYILSGFGIMCQEKSGNPAHANKKTFFLIFKTKFKNVFIGLYHVCTYACLY
jgi:hypothetical protein